MRLSEKILLHAMPEPPQRLADSPSCSRWGASIAVETASKSEAVRSPSSIAFLMSTLMQSMRLGGESILRSTQEPAQRLAALAALAKTCPRALRALGRDGLQDDSFTIALLHRFPKVNISAINAIKRKEVTPRDVGVDSEPRRTRPAFRRGIRAQGRNDLEVNTFLSAPPNRIPNNRISLSNRIRKEKDGALDASADTVPRGHHPVIAGRKEDGIRGRRTSPK